MCPLACFIHSEAISPNVVEINNPSCHSCRRNSALTVHLLLTGSYNFESFLEFFFHGFHWHELQYCSLRGAPTNNIVLKQSGADYITTTKVCSLY